ncbi:MAG TPA: MASE1 domain-containing protein [Rhodanobacteraceae bacterium]|nr:MASE1 domain-containing protein [Rhodanobacteraceae bacterium]
MLIRLPHAWRGPLVGLAYLLVWLSLWPTQAAYWNLLAGWRFGMLLLTPLRYWPWLIAAEWGGSAVADVWLGQAQGMAFMLGDMPNVLVTALCIGIVRQLGTRPALHSPDYVVRLLASALFASLATTMVDALLIAFIHKGVHLGNMFGILGGDLLGDYLGMLLVVPVLILLVRSRPGGAALRTLLLDGLIFLLPSLAVLFLLIQDGPPLSEFARTLALAPVLFFAFRHGWRGTAASILIVSVSMMAFAAATRHLATPAQAHLFLAVAGTATLMLGSAIDALRRSSDRLSVQNARLEGANHRLDHLARRLSDAARRNLRVDEEQRRYMAAELHDELGQNLTAIQTRVKLAQSRLKEAGLEDVSASINTIIGHMRAAVRRMLDNLRPTVLDEFGLARALEEGPIQSLLHTAGIAYDFDLHGDPHPLDEDTRIAIYRVAQEAATNTVRHAHASHVRLRLRVGQRNGQQWVLLDIRDNGIGLPDQTPPRRGGRGLQSMRDRVTALGGIFRIRPCKQGTRLRILLRSTLDNEANAPSAIASEASRNLSDTATT